MILSSTHGNGVTGTLAYRSTGFILNLVSSWRVITGILYLSMKVWFFEFAVAKGRGGSGSRGDRRGDIFEGYLISSGYEETPVVVGGFVIF